MSEAIMYAIDASHVKDADAAMHFVEKWQDTKEAPSARIATFFVRLLQTWPEDESKGAVWHEDFTHNQPAGLMLTMVFELSEFDAERLQQLRAIAKHHGVHIFDPEGYVLYLSDGSEASTSVIIPEIGSPTQCKSGVRFDGVYETRMKESWSYLCFTSDGKIFWQSIGGRFPARSVMDTFITGDAFIVKGNYKPGINAFSARLKAAFGSFKMEGTFKDDGLHVHSERTNGKYPYDTVYTFLPL
ncbi:hypothetical protein GCM10011613_23470 [Cellvibrio zantedeschiae]|uniref:Uncharacterized protein n=1 Tax=Cellvibrio zantedeschiae TaxID=1237077 RepID=A0ABQ3B4P0_9GAMM|nr:hypothetical protein [Cellvibrio zantedeschiae]GGY78180.1 hypothetical protein GCM10011613_23470 [Cellvibrio zantedeschiae]